MGKRKKSSRKPVGPKKREPLATIFRCVFCNTEDAVSVKMDRKVQIGNLTCKACGINFQSTINYLSAPIDVYCDWIDACDDVAKEQPGAEPSRAAQPALPRISQPSLAARKGLAPGETLTEEDRGFVVDDEEDAEAEYADADDD